MGIVATLSEFGIRNIFVNLSCMNVTFGIADINRKRIQYEENRGRDDSNGCVGHGILNMIGLNWESGHCQEIFTPDEASCWARMVAGWYYGTFID